MSYEVNRLNKRVLTNRAIRELNMKGVKYFNHRKLQNLTFSVLKDLYESTFEKELKRKSRKDREGNDNGNIYIIYNSEDNVCKIGYSKKPMKRLRSLQTSYPKELKLMFYFKGTQKDEKEIHKVLSDYKLKGEWFTLCKEVLDNVNEYKKELQCSS